MSHKHPKRPLIFLITGVARAGKDTFAAALRSHLPTAGNRIEIYKFAYVLKDLANHQLRRMGLPGDFHDEKFKNDNRDYLVALGRFLRSIDKDIFAKHLLAQVQGDIDFCDLDTRVIAIVSDWRYANEYEFLKKHIDADIVTIEICRPGFEPANNEEGDSLAQLFLDCKVMHKRIASDARTLQDMAREMSIWY